LEKGFTRRVEDNVLSQIHDGYLQITLLTQSKLSTYTYIWLKTIFLSLYSQYHFVILCHQLLCVFCG